ncbi:SIR2 family protein [Prosthecobacter sp. SYSU 5D2]|uniref:SIR2 family protein n=1 Tax=Prosthecobacter sp. SYSU 5D2 TaxID=3134134 RepID=UPI0031FEBE9E
MSQKHVRQRALDELGAAFKNGRASLFVGAGISAISGLPSWSGLLDELIVELKGQPGVSTRLIADARKLLKDRSKWLTLAQLLRNELGKKFNEFVGRRFADSKIKPNEVHDLIVDLPWSAIVTTNYDRLIERAFARKLGDQGDIPVLTYASPGGIASNYRRGEKFIVKAHGDAKMKPESVVLTESDYRNLVHREIGYQAVLQALFTTNSFLFIGCSLADPDLRMMLTFLHSAFHGDTATHYALIPSDERLDAEDKVLFHDFSIHVIPVDKRKRTEEITNFLEDLKKACSK